MHQGLLDWYVVLMALIGVPMALGAASGFTSGARPRAVGCSVMLVGLLVAWAWELDLRFQREKAREGWNLIAVVVAADAIDPGTVITFDMISQRPIPEQFVADSMVRPDRANEVVGKPTHGHLQAGDPLTWTTMGVGLASDACALNAR